MLSYFFFGWGREVSVSEWVKCFIRFVCLWLSFLVSYSLFISWFSCVSCAIYIEHLGYFSALHPLVTRLRTYELTRRTILQVPGRVKPD